MKKIEIINDNWTFTKQGVKTVLDLPHTYNGIDGQGGELTYYKGEASYTRIVPKAEGTTYLRFEGVNNRCEVYINGRKAGAHKGGYSAFNIDVTSYLTSPKNFVEVVVNNSNHREIYPERADFTFYGGIYRSVKLISNVPKTHFSLDDYGSNGIYITPKINGDVHVKALISGYHSGVTVMYEVLDKNGNIVAYAGNKVRLHVDNPVLWNGLENPYLYTLRASIYEGGELLDREEIKFGFREIKFDPDKGCFLNGKHIKLNGVSRHQDRETIGNALTYHCHEEDLKLIKETGANSIRLAHYQQAQEFYSLCDEMGFLVWAEVPVISTFSAKKQNNALQQLEELIKQSFNHASIFCWGVCNEISMGGENKKLLDSIKELNDLAHAIDPSRPTTLAQLTMCDVGSSMNKITDIMGYNHYYGWYMKTVEGLNEWLPKYKEACPDMPLCLSEYGAEAILGYYNDDPYQGDYSEGYQAKFLEHYFRTIEETDWLWGAYVWNMFDFGSAIRNEGGVKGRNNKGMVTFDRSVKKDSFYVAKAFWSDEKFVHIEGDKYKFRTIGERTFRVESNCKSVTLTCGDYEKTIEGKHVFTFENVPIKEGENLVTVKSDSGEEASCSFEGVEKYPETYSRPADSKSMVRNWFLPKAEKDDPNYFSIEDTIGDILENDEIRGMLSGVAGEFVNNKYLIKGLKHVKLKSVLEMKLLPINDDMKNMVVDFLGTVKKKP